MSCHNTSKLNGIFSCHSGKQEMTDIMRQCHFMNSFYFLLEKNKILLCKYSSNRVNSVIEEILNHNLRSGEGEWRLNIIKS